VSTEEKQSIKGETRVKKLLKKMSVKRDPHFLWLEGVRSRKKKNACFIISDTPRGKREGRGYRGGKT